MGKYFPDLIDEYKQNYAELLRLEKRVANSEHSKTDGPVIRNMIYTMKQTIDWLETGYDPAEVRANTRIDAIVMDHRLMQDVVAEVLYYNDDAIETMETTDYNKERIRQALEGLTDNERAVFIMIRVELMPFSKVAKVLGVSKGTVQSYLQRAERKIQLNARMLVA